MKFLLWERRFETGNAQIDEQHRHEFDYINKVHRSVVEENPREQIEAHMKTLLSRLESHFKHEELEMKRSSYEHAEIHDDEHKKLLDQLGAYYQKYKEGDTTAAYDFLEYIHSWFIRHLENQDREFGEFLAARETSS